MHSSTRRQFLRCTRGVFIALPSIGCATDQGASNAAVDNDCSLSVARLIHGQPVTATDAGVCQSATGSPSIFQGASLAKPIVATLALRMALREELDLERPLSDYLQDGYVHRQNLFALREPPVVDVVPSEILRRITVRSLLSHTSGLPNWSSKEPLRFAFDPGSRWGYSGEGYVLVQHLLHTLTGKPLNTLASEELFGPIRMRETALKLTDQVAGSLVSGRSASGQVRQLRFPYEIAASSLYTTAADYANFMAYTLADQRLLALITDTPVPLPGVFSVYWGLGWGIESTASHKAIWHWGNNPGFRAIAMADLGSKDAVVALAASDLGMARAKAILGRALPGQHPGLQLGIVQ